jgi:hypothetical protein
VIGIQASVAIGAMTCAALILLIALRSRSLRTI